MRSISGENDAFSDGRRKRREIAVGVRNCHDGFDVRLRGGGGLTVARNTKHTSDRDSQDAPDGGPGDRLDELEEIGRETFVVLQHLLFRSVLLPRRGLSVEILAFWTDGCQSSRHGMRGR